MDFRLKDRECTGAPSFCNNGGRGLRPVNLQRAMKSGLFTFQVRKMLVLCCILFMCLPVRCFADDIFTTYFGSFFQDDSREFQEFGNEPTESYEYIVGNIIERVTLNNGLKCPMLGLGTWQGTDADSPDDGVLDQAIRNAIDFGYRHFDCASYYKNEKIIGAVIRDKIDSGFVKRSDLYITDKLWNTDHKPEDVLPALKKSLNALGLSYIDLYLMHWPMATTVDDDGQIVESNYSFVDTWKAMEHCVKIGLTKSIGVSNFNITQMKVLLESATILPVVNQVENHPYLTQNLLNEYCQLNGIKLVAYAPLGSPYAIKPGSPNKLLIDPVVRKMAARYDKTPAQILIRFQIQRGNLVIPKSNFFERQYENMDVWNFVISDQDMNKLFSLNRNLRFHRFEQTKHMKYYPFAEEKQYKYIAPNKTLNRN